MSFGLKRSVDKHKIREHAGYINGYDVYKVMFQSCEDFNRHYRDRIWPHERGGHGVDGHFSRAHDFYLASILQNTFNLYFELGVENGRNIDFLENCVSLADELFTYACSL